MYAKNNRKLRKLSPETRSVAWDETIKIEYKVFTLRLENGGWSIWWSERTRNSSYVMDLDCEEARWINLRFKDYINSPYPGSDFHRYRGRNFVFTIQRFANKRGRFFEMSKYNNQGRKQTNIVPSGFNSEGWKNISIAFGKLMSGQNQRRISQHTLTQRVTQMKSNRIHQDERKFERNHISATLFVLNLNFYLQLMIDHVKFPKENKN